MTQTIYAIGDIHGHLGPLIDIHARIEKDRAAHADRNAEVIHIGDYTDRGPDSKGVIDYLIAGQNRGEKWRFLLGNHDRLFAWFLADPNRVDPRLRTDYTWLSQNMGGRTTLASYGAPSAETADPMDLYKFAQNAVPDSHRKFMQDLETYIEKPDLLFVHAGIRPGIPMAKQSVDDLVWIRQEFHDHSGPHPALIIHGHTSIDEVTHYGNRVNIDTGMAWGRHLSAIVIEGKNLFELSATGRRLLQP